MESVYRTAMITLSETSFGFNPCLKELMNHKEITNAISIPRRGARTINDTVFITGSGFTLVKPAWAMAAPAKPPISVCEDEEGIPYHQVSRFQDIAATNPEMITGSVMNSSFTVLAIVFATPWSLNIKKATKLKKAAQTTA
jgi:hypothetical protein